ncbi:MAG: AAA family ATPase [Desulfobulbaceae bacterium]|nr:AAA family ATPase [Desulfobulbaceae bacterium]
MIKSFEINNFGPLSSLQAEGLGKLNLVIGANSSGKTFLLKALYAMIRSQEEYGRGEDPRDFSEVLGDKLYWTFQADKLGDLVQKGVGNRLAVSVTMQNNCSLAFEFGQDTSRKVVPLHNNLPLREANSIFLPPKEVLTLAQIILKSGLQDKAFGFDATYVDLVLALQNPTQRGRNFDAFARSRQQLERMFQGKIEYIPDAGKWVYKKGNSRFSLNTTAEGIKKIAILDMLLGNRFLTPESVVFIDEPESALHPSAISQLLDIICQLSEAGIQFLIASHSYFVVKKLYLIALSQNMHLPVLIADQDGGWHQEDLLNGIPDNEIINESIRLFDQELEVSNK